jgi:hypothetical protein
MFEGVPTAVVVLRNKSPSTGLFYGARRARTADLLGAIQALSQLSYSPGRRSL